MGISIDAADIGTNCNGDASSGIVFCASPYDQPWDVTALSSNSITFMAQQNGDFLTNGDAFFINIFFPVQVRVVSSGEDYFKMHESSKGGWDKSFSRRVSASQACGEVRVLSAGARQLEVILS